MFKWNCISDLLNLVTSQTGDYLLNKNNLLNILVGYDVLLHKTIIEVKVCIYPVKVYGGLVDSKFGIYSRAVASVWV